MKTLLEELIEMLKQNTANLKATADNIDAVNRYLSGSSDSANYSRLPFRVDNSGKATKLISSKGRVSVS
jgi:hypothetical protein